MEKAGSTACFASSAYKGGTNLERIARGTDELQMLRNIAQYALTMGRTISQVNNGAVMCAHLLLSQARLQGDILQAECPKAEDVTHNTCSIPRNLNLYQMWLDNA